MSLAAIQALNRKVTEKQVAIDDLARRNADLEKRLADLETLVAKLAPAVQKYRRSRSQGAGPRGPASCPFRCTISFRMIRTKRQFAQAAPPWQLLLEEEREPDPVRFWGRAALYAFLFVWGWRFILSSVAGNYVAASFLHMVNLPFHEAGHVFFGPFGDFPRALGGTLGQLLSRRSASAPSCSRPAIRSAPRSPSGGSARASWTSAPHRRCPSGELLLLGGVTGRDVPAITTGRTSSAI